MSETPMVGRLLRLYRSVNEIGCLELARDLGISHATLSRVERGHAMDLDTWLKVQSWLLRKDGSR